jgi:hypothetical protein
VDGGLGLISQLETNLARAALDDQIRRLSGRRLSPVRTSLGAGLVNQGWKDSSEAISGETGLHVNRPSPWWKCKRMPMPPIVASREYSSHSVTRSWRRGF